MPLLCVCCCQCCGALCCVVFCSIVLCCAVLCRQISSEIVDRQGGGNPKMFRNILNEDTTFLIDLASTEGGGFVWEKCCWKYFGRSFVQDFPPF